jgi:hypothetical protein
MAEMFSSEASSRLKIACVERLRCVRDGYEAKLPQVPAVISSCSSGSPYSSSAKI